MRIVKIIIVCVLSLLYACSSNAPVEEAQYFVLTPVVDSSMQKNNAQTDKKHLILENIKLAKFLDQAGIILQTDMHQIEVAHYHRWAEPLKHNIYRYLQGTLSSLSKYQFINKQNRTGSPTNEVLAITVNQFHGTTSGKALLSGHWIFKQAKHDFAYQASFTQSGYPELVKQLALLLDELSRDITAELDMQ